MTAATPTVARTRAELTEALAALPAGHRLALVPTMGALHAGHLALVAAARLAGRADAVVVSIFVNPLQFGPAEDLTRYPRPIEADLAACAAAGVDVVFVPDVDLVYPRPALVTVDPGPLATGFEGAVRPGHFVGVLTVVLKMFGMVRPDVAVFGQKDAQQLAIVRRMVADLDVPVEILAAPIVREPDGLALSSRNVYLSGPDRFAALALSRSLAAAAEVAAAGAPPSMVTAAAAAVLGAEPDLSPDYAALVDPATFTAVPEDYSGDGVFVVAGRVGSTRLIDNAPMRIATLRPVGRPGCDR